MREWQSLSRVRWYCGYHVVIVPKYRKKVIFGSVRKGIGKILWELCQQEGIELVEGHAMGDHVHLCLSIPPKFSVANIWSRGYCVSTLGLDRSAVARDTLALGSAEVGSSAGRAAASSPGASPPRPIRGDRRPMSTRLTRTPCECGRSSRGADTPDE
jgi:putative transposase